MCIDNRVLYSMRILIILALTGSLLACSSSSTGPASTSDNAGKGKIRFYRVNDLGQQTALTVVKGADKTGCHNFFKKSRLHRVAVTGFQYCEVFADKNCAAGSKLSAQWQAKKIKSEDKKQPTTTFTKGTRWVFDKGGNIRAHSWRCVE